MRFGPGGAFTLGRDFSTYVIDAFDWLHREGATAPKMLSLGLHLRVIGKPGLIAALERILGHVRERGGVWIATRADIATHWRARHAS